MSADASKLRDALDRWGSDVLRGAVEDMPDLIRPVAPIGEATETSTRAPGQLRDSITVSVPGSSGGPVFRGSVAAPVPQAVWTDKGTSPHPIDPVGEGYPLRFFWARTGRVMYFMHVNHPGNPAQNWWEPAVRDAFARALLDRALATSLAA